MAEFQQFRTAIGGFHRGDVADYIENMSLQHRKDMQGLLEEIKILQEENDGLKEKLAAAEAAAKACCPQEGAPAAAAEPVQKEEIPENPEALELQAYRRAEAAERTAMQRIRKQTDKLDGIMASIDDSYTDAGTELEALAAAVREDTAKIQQIFDALNQSFAESKAAINELREEAEV